MTAVAGNDAEELVEVLQRACRRALGEEIAVRAPVRLSGGASAETWAFDLRQAGGERACILRRSPGAGSGSRSLSREGEARLQEAARRAGVPAAEVLFVLEPGDGLGSGYVMERIDGETLAPRILREDAYAGARETMAGQLGGIAARIHGLDPGSLPSLETLDAAIQLERYRDLYDDYDDPHAVFEWAFRWLEQRLPDAAPEPVPVHGDFRLGNLMVGADGVRAVLDWELAHLGDPMEDLGWICVRSWRFGRLHEPVGGFGRREDLWNGYRRAGGELEAERARFWEIFGSLKWGVMCMSQGFAHLRGEVRSVERAAIGRRCSETEIDLLHRIVAGGD